MAQRDYAGKKGHSKKKKGGNKNILLFIALLLIAAFAFGLFWLKQKSVEIAPMIETKSTETRPKSQLPSRPEETWSYIKELESRTVIGDNSQAALDKMAKLTDKQKEELKRLQETEQKSALEKAKKAEESIPQPTMQTREETSMAPAVKDDAQLKAEQEQKLAEQKKLEEQRKKEEERKKIEAKKAEDAKLASAKKAENTPSEANKTTGKFGLQCGAFNDRGKAENLQGRLAMAGLNAKIVQSGNWNRVLIGPIGDRTATISAQQQANSIINCVIIGM
ncbi:MAG: cell division protein FtsN [Lonepinella koalarum]|nr:cell division protein FtsN [Lonepinella koalarum]